MYLLKAVEKVAETTKEVPLISPEVVKSFAKFLAEHGVKKETIEVICGVVQTDYFLCGTIVVTSLIVAGIAYLFMKGKEKRNSDFICITNRKRKIKRYQTYNYGSSKDRLLG